MPRTNGTAATTSVLECCAPNAATRPATSGAKSTDAPIVATHPPRTAPHEVAAGRTRTPRSVMTDSFREEEKSAMTPCNLSAAGRATAKRGLRALLLLVRVPGQ